MGSPASLIGKLAKTLFFNPIMVAPWIGWYRTTSYIVEKYGGYGMIKSLFNFKIFKYVKEAYDNDLKKKFFPTVLETFLTIFPIHFFSMNYVANPTYRVGIGAINDTLFSMISGEEGFLKTLCRKITGKKKENNVASSPYSPGSFPAPDYAAQQPYKMAA